MARKSKATPDPIPTNNYKVLGTDFSGVILLLVCVIVLIALLGFGPGFFNEGLANVLKWLVGIIVYPLTLAGIIGGALMIFRPDAKQYFSWSRLLMAELMLVCFLGIVTLIYNPTLSWDETSLYQSGGVIGRLVATLVSPLGTGGGVVVLSVLALLLLPKLLNVPLGRIEDSLKTYRHNVDRHAARLRLPAPTLVRNMAYDNHDTDVTPPTRRAVALDPAPRISSPIPPSTATPQTPAPKPTASSVVERIKNVVADKIPPVTLPISLANLANGGRTLSPATTTAKAMPRYEMPPLDLLQTGGKNSLDPNIAREKARIIEETLQQFHVPATVVQVNQGPSVTQFGIQPGFIEFTRKDGSVEKRKVKVNAITSLADDLALSLSAKSIRVEAPVPGRPYVGIEVPNSDTEMVTLHDVLTSDDYKEIKSQLGVALGRDVSGNPIAADLGRMPHLLIAGATGSGKSVCVNTLILSLLFHNTPEQLKLLMIDPKMVELIPYNGIPHLVAPVVTDMEKVVGALTWAQREMDRRYKMFAEAGKRNHEAYNEWAKENQRESLPYIVIIIDELADLMMVAADQVERIICRIAQMARATGIHLILATQRPSVDVVTGLIKANIPTRIAFAVASGIDSRVILDSVGAESLLGRGDMLYMAPDQSKLQRLQGCFVSDNEMQRVVEHWLRAKPKTQVTPAQTPWDDIVAEANSSGGDKDELLEKATEIVRESQWASTSFLQRKLRIGYTRAARLMDMMEEQGIVGPPEGNNGSSRKVLLPPLESKAEMEEL